MGRQHRNKETESAGDALQQCEAWLNDVILKSPIPQFVIDSSHRIVHWNLALEKYSGIKADDINGTNQHWRAFYPDERPCLADLLVDGAENRIPELYQGKYAESTLVDGAYEATDFFPHMGESGVWLYFTATAIRDEEGRITGAVETLEDITGRKRAEEALRKSEERYRLFVQKFQGIAYQATPDWIPIFFHGAVEEITGYTEENFISGNPRWDQIIIPEDLAVIIARDNEKLLNVTGHSIQREYRIIRKDGEVRWLSDFIQNQIGETGEIVLSGILTDITGRKRAEEALRESEAKFRSIFDWANDAILLHTLTTDSAPGRFIEVNQIACRMLGYTGEELQTMGPTDIVPIELHPQLKDIIRKAKSEKNFIFEMKFQRKDGTTFPVESSCHLVDYDGEKIWISHIRDITKRKQAEEALKESEERFRQIAESAGDWIWEVDADGLYTYVSPVVERILGYKPEELVGTMHFYDLFAPEVREELKKAAMEDFASQEPFKGFVNRNIHKNGDHVILETSGVPHYDETGRFIGYRGADTDVTERKKAEEALKESESQYRSLFENVNEGILFSDIETRKFVHANPAICRMLGYSSDELLSMSVKDIHPKEHHSRIFSEFQRLGDGETGFVADIPCLCKDGKILMMNITGSRLVTQGRIYLAGFFTDVTERFLAEEALRKSEEKYRSLVENISDVIFSINIGAEITYISPIIEEIYGYAPDEVTGRKFTQFIHPDDIPVVIEGFRRRIRGEYGENIFRIIAKDGSDHYVRTTQTPIIRDGMVTGFNYVMTDFTERRKAEEALQQANKKLNMLSSVTRHDILNQIMGARGHLELSKNLAEDPTLQEYINIAIESIDLIQRQIEFTKYYQDIGMDEPEWHDAGEIINRLTGSLSLKGIILDNFLAGLEIFADPLIEKVFFNLMENSIRHGEHVTAIGFSCSETNDGLVISYRDNGIGIMEEDKKKLFKKGFGKHTGLGLFLSSEILSITGITIKETGVPGEGVNFEIVVPKGGYRYTSGTTK